MEEYTEFEYGVCKFCLSEGHHKDITKEYWDDGERENYSAIILECFNIFISTSGSSKALICADCVTRLRAAVLFRELLLRAAQDLSARTPDTPALIEDPAMNTETIKMELKTEPGDEIEIVEHGIQKYVKLRAVSGLTAGQQKEPPKSNRGNKKRVAPYPCEDSGINVEISPCVRDSPLSSIITNDAQPSFTSFGCLVCGKVFLHLTALRKHTAEHAVFKLRAMLSRSH